MKLARSNNTYLLKILYFSLLCSFLLNNVCHGQTSMPDYARLNPIIYKQNIHFSPTDVALDASENVYVVESINNRLLKFSQSGQYLNAKIGLNKPISVAVDSNGIIYIGNKDTGNVEVYDVNLLPLRKLGIGNGEFGQPNSIDIDSNGNIYVVDYDQNSVKVYSSDGSYHHCYGCPANGSGQFEYPKSIVIDKTTQEVIILDQPYLPLPNGGSTKFGRIQTFQVNGSSWTLQRSFSNYGAIEGQMNKPQGVEIDETGRVYVTEAQFQVVYVYHSDCTVNGIPNYCGKISDALNPLRTPMGIIRSNSNRLFIASLGTEKIEVFGLVPYTNMEIVPLSLSFGDCEQYSNNPAAKSVEIRNNGTQILDWTASTTDNWLTLSESSGSIGISSTVTLDIGVDLTVLTPGTHTGSISISSASGATETVNVSLTLTSNPPFAHTGGSYSAFEGQSILLDASNSTGSLVLYQWDIDYDDVTDSYEYSSEFPTQFHTYNQSGTYSIKLKVTNPYNLTDESITTAYISDAVPTADFSASATSGAAPLSVIFTNNSNGYDQPLTFEWDFNNDGTIDSTSLNPLYVYDNAETYSVALTVRDSDGSETTLTRPFYIFVSEGTCTNPPVRISDSFDTLQEAYNAAAEGDTIQIQSLILSENPELTINKTVTLEGGYDCDYISSTGNTTIYGTMTISGGTVTIGNFILY